MHARTTRLTVLIAAALACLVLPTRAVPPEADYCEMLARDVEGKQYSFIAGNHMYYIGGKVDEKWRPREHETIGFTHPMFRDGRARGFGIATGAGGTGHDKMGWEFWNHIRGAYGTVVVDGKRHKHPRPQSMIWRPDRVTCTYVVGGAKITEVKFISKNDVLCTIITADRPVDIRFEGHSFVNPDRYPTFDGDKPGQVFSQERTASGRFDSTNNAIDISEGGTILTKLNWRKPAVVGRIMYDGMSIVLSSGQPIQSPTVERDGEGRQAYAFTLSCAPNMPTVLTYSVGDEYEAAVRRTKSVLNDPAAALAAKTAWFNDLLNTQIPYFRCSDEAAVKTYYYLWSLYFMYFTYTGKGYEMYPHTQTAINNFMGLHLWDSWVYTAMGSWVVDREAWGYGNVLSWKSMVPFKDERNGLPDNFGTTWYSPGVWMNLVGSVELSWDMYLKSGDREFLDTAYNALFRPLYWDGKGPQESMGIELNALRDLIRMARELGRDADVPHWEGMHPGMLERFTKNWGAYCPSFYAEKGSPWKDIWHLASMMCDEMPTDWANAQCDDWVMNTETGFLGPVSLRIRPPNDPPNGVFRVSTISTWLAVEGMFRHHRDWDAVFITLNHINAMNKDLGFPVAPECWDPDDKPWGSLYYNWDSAITDLILKRLAGVQYSIPDQTVTVAEHTPEAWDFLEVQIPIAQKGKVDWVQVRVDQEKTKQGVRKVISIRNNPLGNLVIEPWLADREIIRSSAKLSAEPRRMAYTDGGDHDLVLHLGKTTVERRTLAVLTPGERVFGESIKVNVINLEPNTTLRCSTDGHDPGTSSPEYGGPIALTETTDLKLRAFTNDGVARSPMTVMFTKAELLPASEPKSPKPGLAYKFFRGNWKRIPDMSKLDADGSGVTRDLNIARAAGQAEDFAIQLDGYIKVPEDGLYNFAVRSDDGSRLTIDGATVVELNVLCARDAWSGDGTIALKQGYHKVRIDYFQAHTHVALEIRASVNGGPHTPVGAEMLFHEEGE